MPSYYPECDEPKPTGENIILESSFNFRDSYSVEWSDENNAKVRELFKANRVRPMKNGLTLDGTRFTPAENTTTNRAYWSCLVTSKSMDKLRPYSAHSVLLD